MPKAMFSDFAFAWYHIAMQPNDAHSPFQQTYLGDNASTTRTFRTSRGRSAPLGAVPLAEGVNFVLMCRHGTSVHLVLLPVDSDEPLGEFLLDPRTHRTGDLWHI